MVFGRHKCARACRHGVIEVKSLGRRYILAVGKSAFELYYAHYGVVHDGYEFRQDAFAHGRFAGGLKSADTLGFYEQLVGDSLRAQNAP